MTSFLNGKKELEGPITFAPMETDGRASLGVRLNEVYWFKGAIREARFHKDAISENDLQRKPSDQAAISGPISRPPDPGSSHR